MFDTLLDEQSILGLALGAGLAGLLPVPEIQYLAYLHNAADQIRGEAATLSSSPRASTAIRWWSASPGSPTRRASAAISTTTTRWPACAISPGLLIACPARPDDAPAMLRTCLAAAQADGRVCVFLEPIALYHTRDLAEPGDGGWLARYDPPGRGPPGTCRWASARCHGDGA